MSVKGMLQQIRVISLPTYLPEIVLSLLTFVAAFGFISLAERQPTISDSIGYITAGQRLAGGHGLTFTDTLNLSAGPLFYPHAFRMVGENTADAVFGYPPGYPVLIAIGVLLSGQLAAAYYAVPILATLSLPLTYWVGRLLTGRKWTGVWSALIVAGAATLWRFSTAPWSEVPSLVFILGGVGMYVFSRQRLQSNQATFLTDTAAAVLIGFSFFVRYTNVILVMPAILAYEVYTGRLAIFQDRRRWWFYVVVGMLAGGVLLFNWTTLGGPFKSIYSSPELGAYPWPYFSWTYAIGPSPINGFSFYETVSTLWANFHVLLLLAPVGWFSMKRASAMVSGGIVLSTLTLYSVYAFAPTDVNARFLLPMFPFLSIAIASGVTKVAERFLQPSMSWVLSIVGIGLLFAPIVSLSAELQARNAANAAVVEHVKNISSQVPAGSVWMSNSLNDLFITYAEQSALNYRRGLLADPTTGRFDLGRYEACLVQTVDQLLAMGTPVYFVLDQGWNTSKIVEAHFLLAAVEFDPNTFKIEGPHNEEARHLLSSCNY